MTEPLKTRNSEVLASFIAYCQSHPDERFWQALRNWCGWHYVYVSSDQIVPGSDGRGPQNTFNWESKDS